MSSSPPTASPQHPSAIAPRALFRISHGQQHGLALPAGAEVFCANGLLLLQTAPLEGLDHAPGLQLRLHTGQSWRAPCALWLQATALQGPARLQTTPVVDPVSAAPVPPPATAWTHLGAVLAAWWAHRPLRQRKAQ